MDHAHQSRWSLGVLLAAVALCGVATGPLRAQEDGELAKKAVSVLEKTCYKCHGQNGAKEGGFGYALEVKKLIERKKIVPKNLEKSRLLARIIEGEMPPKEEKVRPSEAEVALLKQWIEAGAPEPPLAAVVKPRPYKTTRDVLLVIRDHLRKINEEDRPYQRFFTITHLHNLKKVRDFDLVLYRAALSKLINSLSWKHQIVIPQPIDAEGTVMVVDLRDLDWDRPRLWAEILKVYPYGLSHMQYPNDPAVRELAREVYHMCGTELPMVRADWFIATASRPPLYHIMVRIPKTAWELERRLEVDAASNYFRGTAARSGFAHSGVSRQYRMVERHPALYGAYWKSYDFKSNVGRGNFFEYPLGPEFKNHPYPDLTFKQDGGEMIFNLPNGMQAYMLVNGKDERIDEGPTEVVRDKQETSGTVAVVNGISCMACHQHGMIRGYKDEVRFGTQVKGDALRKVEILFRDPKQMEQYMDEDEARFLTAVDRACSPFLRTGPDDKRDIRSFPESITPIAHWYRLQNLGLEEAAAELGVEDPKMLGAAIQYSGELQRAGLLPLAQPEGTISREVWESLARYLSPFHYAAKELKLGTPQRVN